MLHCDTVIPFLLRKYTVLYLTLPIHEIECLFYSLYCTDLVLYSCQPTLSVLYSTFQFILCITLRCATLHYAKLCEASSLLYCPQLHTSVTFFMLTSLLWSVVCGLRYSAQCNRLHSLLHYITILVSSVEVKTFSLMVIFTLEQNYMITNHDMLKDKSAEEEFGHVICFNTGFIFS